MGIFQTFKGSKLPRPWSNLAKFRTHSRFYSCKNEDDRIINEGARVLTTLYAQRQKKPIGHYLGQIWKNN